MFEREVVKQIEAVALEWGFDAAALLAIAEVESGGRVFADIDGRPEPLIRWEGHYFDRRLAGDARATARAARLAHPLAGAVPNPKTQTGRWQLLARAEAITRNAAYESVSWGIGQVMGAHWQHLGYASVEALVAEARLDATGQARLMARFIDKNGLRPALEGEDWRGFAHGYNGPGFVRNAYDQKLGVAFRRFAALALLRPGMRGDRVRRLQAALAQKGKAVAADGVFGPLTRTALEAFQSSVGLRPDGLAGSRTFRALGL